MPTTTLPQEIWDIIRIKMTNELQPSGKPTVPNASVAIIETQSYRNLKELNIEEIIRLLNNHLSRKYHNTSVKRNIITLYDHGAIILAMREEETDLQKGNFVSIGICVPHQNQ